MSSDESVFKYIYNSDDEEDLDLMKEINDELITSTDVEEACIHINRMKLNLLNVCYMLRAFYNLLSFS
ncbi:hypothetical protein EMPG_11355 [Blastomyces silverae]|uniref:Uncharacterized protein n=1 Tax=Blastomyces silverae TaxID=2060906 RepID=A0A0H1BXD5_9EURO|nr:hypothetical protein EMPG_11355 [Blastomyces silverae]